MKIFLPILVFVLVVAVGSSLRIAWPPKSKACYQPVKVGPCKAKIPRWYYHRGSNTCKQFDWGGCQPNDNNFKTKAHCLLRCKKSKSTTNICLLKKETGRCRARFIRYYYNSKAKQCQTFIYGGCGGNKNRFRTKKQCVKRCPYYKG